MSRVLGRPKNRTLFLAFDFPRRPLVVRPSSVVVCASVFVSFFKSRSEKTHLNMLEPAHQSNWTLATDDNTWMTSNQNPMFVEGNSNLEGGSLSPSSLTGGVQTGGPGGPLYSSQSVQVYPNYVSLGYYDVDLYGWKPVSFPSGNEENPIDSSLFNSLSSSSPPWSSTSVVQVQADQLALQQKAVAIEDQLNSQSLYKTELCRSFEETGTCRYGTKCQFAHGKDELRPVLRHPKYKTEICRTFHNSGTCPYGKRCRFIHLSADEGNLNSINIIPWTRSFEDSLDGEGNPEEIPEDFDVDEALASKMRALEIAAAEKSSRKTKSGGSKSSRSVKPSSSTKTRKPPRSTKPKSIKKPNPLSWEDSQASNKPQQQMKQAGDNHRLAFFAHLSGDSVPSTQPSSQ